MKRFVLRFRRRLALSLLPALFLAVAAAGPLRAGTPLGSIRLSDPAILADSASGIYYLTGTGGRLWHSRDLKQWEGPVEPRDYLEIDSTAWMGSRPEIWAAELHAYRGAYYLFATFTNHRVQVDTVAGRVLERRACHVLRSERPEGPYRLFGDPIYLPADKLTLDGTLWVEPDGTPYLVYCHEWLQTLDGTIERIELKPDLSGTVGEPKLLFRASESPWSREEGSDRPNMVTDGPWLFRTQTGRLGMLWTSWIGNIYTQGVAYSASGTLDGPWVQEPEPITPPDFGHGMLFRTFDGQWFMSVHSHEDRGGRYHRVPHLFSVDLSGDKLQLGPMLHGLQPDRE